MVAVHVFACMHKCMHVCVYAHINVCAFLYMCVFVFVCICEWLWMLLAEFHFNMFIYGFVSEIFDINSIFK